MFDVSAARPVLRGVLDLRKAGLHPQRLLFDGDRVLVVGIANRQLEGKETASLALVELDAKGRLRLLAREDVVGRVTSARVVGGAARVLVSTVPDLPFLVPGKDQASSDRALAYNRDLVAGAKAADWLPVSVVVDGAGRVVRKAGPAVDCTDVRAPAVDSGLDVLTVLSVDLTRADALIARTSAAVVATGALVHTSADRLYVATTEGGLGRFSDRAQGYTPAPAAPGRSGVHSYSLGRTGVRYLASTSLAGYVCDSYGLSARPGILRVVTTSRAPWPGAGSSGAAENAVVVLDATRSGLVEAGRLGGVTPGVGVRTVRWLGDLAAIVTTRQADPLYLVDLAAPRPVLRGELDLPSYAGRVYDLGGGRLLAFGEDVTPENFSNGLKLLTADVSDPDRPRIGGEIGYGSGSHGRPVEARNGRPYLAGGRTAFLTGEVDAIGWWDPGLLAVRVEPDGSLAKGPTWPGRPYGPNNHRGGGVVEVLPLGGGRLVALTETEISILDEGTFAVLGRAPLGGRR